ncbi:mucin-12 isoform X2 [Drosophila miranda]|uniref:mucin-12 isoform X2 n=1 Tax=Drosophila miranda TaxID=7229 RepID=UPI0007E69A78|nr:mucin-12 isoform X2 [Drosophila miranda]
MEFSTYRISFLWLLGLCLLLFKTGCTEAQGKRASRITSSRSFGTNVKSTSSNGLSFDCPEEFGYYPHPTDCTQYYVCVFGGALLESCTGGLMYSHELQTCDWPRNVGCELVDTSTERGPARSQSQTQQHHQQHVPSRVRFGSAFGSSGGAPKAPTVAPQYHRSPPQVIQAQVQHIPPPPPELRVPPNPVVTSRGQPKPLLDAQEDIAKLYAEAQETLPPVEEEESDRQQRVYRGQPSTVSQVQRDRDGIIHQASINAIPQSGKLGSYAFGTAYSESLDDEQTLEYELSQNRLEALDVDRRPRKRRDLTVQTTPVADTETQTPTEPEPKPEPNVQAEVPNDSNTSSEVMEPESPSPSAKPSSLLGNSESSNSSNNSQEHYDKAAPAVSKPQKYSSKISQPREKSGSAVIEFDYVNTGADGEKGDDGYGDDSPEDAATGESKRRPRQLRPVTHTSTKWTGPNYRAIDAPPPPHQGYQQHQTGQSYSFGSFNPYLTPPANPGHTQQPFGSHNYNQISPGYPAQAYLHQQQQISAPNQQKPKVVYTGYNLSLPPPPLEDDFRPIAGNYFRSPNGVPSSPRTPLPAQNLQQQQQQHSSPGNLLPYLIQQLKELKERRKHLQAENFAYFHLENQPITPGPSPGSTPPTPAAQTPFAYYSHSQVSSGDSSKPTQQVTPNGQFSTMGGFYNNQSPDQAPYTANYAGKLVSQYSIGSTTTESNYFQYNVIANQKMKGVYSTAKPNQIGHAAVKVRPPVTPLQVTQSINIVSAPNLAYSQPAPGLQQVPFRDFSHLPVGISYAGNSTVPESYQTFTKSITSEAPPTPTSPTTANNKPKLSNFQFNIHEFMANLKSSDLASVNPAINPLMKYFKQVSSDGNGNLRNAVVLRRPVPPSSSSNTGTTTTLSTSTPKTRLRPNPTISTPTIPTTTRPLKGYESFIKGIQNQINKQTSTHSASLHTTTTTPTPRIRPTIRTSSSTTTLESVDYYDEDYEEDEDILPPSHMPPYMPMSETMAPPRPQLVSTTAPVTESPGKIRGSFQTGFLEATTTRRPFPNFVQLNSRPSNETGAGAGGVPSFINFPSDIFQELKQRLPQLPESTTPTPGAPTPRSTRPSSTPASTSTRVRYTTRPRTRGQQKWMTMAPPASATAAAKGVENNTERAKNESSSASGYYFGKQSHSSIGGLQLNSIHAGGSGSGADRNRDIEYQQQQQDHQEQQQQQQQQPQQQQQYQQPAVRHQQTQSTYRPLELSATPTPPQKPQYSNQPTLTYSTDYDEDINAQIEQDNVYDQPTRSPQRPEQVAIQRLDARPTSTMTPPTRPDVRHYYDTLTTPNSGIGESDYSYSSSGEYAYNSSPGDYDQSEHTLMQVVTDAGRDTRGDYDLIANFVGHTQRKTTKPPSISGQNTQATPAISGSTTKGFTTQTVRAKKPTTTSTTTTSTRKTTSTTTPPPPTTTTTTTKPQSSKAHANKIYIQHAINMSKTTTNTTQPPTTSTTTPPIYHPSTYSSNPFLKSKLQSLAKSLVSFVANSHTQGKSTNYHPAKIQSQTHSQLQLQRQPEVQVPAQAHPSVTEPSTTQWPLVEDSPSSQLEHAETVFDESQNVHVQTAEAPSSRSFETSTSPKFLDFINAAAYGTSPRGNLLHSVPDKKPVKTAFHQLQKKNPYSGVERGYLNDQRSTVPQQPNKRIQTYISSDVEPQSFRSPASEPLVPVASIELVDSSSSTPGTRPSKAVQYSLQSGSHGFSLRAEDIGHNEGPVVSETLSDRKESQPPSTSTSTITSTGTSASTSTSTSTTPYNSDVDVIPTTYAPPLRIWRNGRPAIQAYTKATTTTTKSAATAPWWTDSVESSSTIRTTTTPKAQGTPSTERYISPGQSFTARANHFKDSLNRVTANPAMRFVSPYKSLENLLQEERQHPNTMLRTTARPRYTNSPASPPFLQTTQKPPKNLFLSGMSPRNTSQDVLATMATGNARNFSVSDAILSTFSPQRPAPSMLRSTTSSSTTSTTETPPPPPTTISAVIASSPIRVSQVSMRPRGRSRYTVATLDNLSESVDEPTTYAPRFRLPSSYEANQYPKRKPQRVRIAGNQRPSSAEPTAKPHEKYESYKAALQAKDSTLFNFQNVQGKNLSAESVNDKLLKRKPIENEASTSDGPRAEALIGHQLLEARQQNSIEEMGTASASSSTEHVVAITDRPPTVKFLYSNKYRQQTAERTLAESLQNAGYLTTGNGRIQKFRPVSVLEQLKQFLAGSDSNSNSNSDESGTSQFVDEYSHPEIKAAVDEIKQLYVPTSRSTTITTTTTLRPTTTPIAPPTTTSRPNIGGVTAPSRPIASQSKAYSSYSSSTFSILSTDPPTSPTVRSTLSTTPDVSTTRTPTIPTTVPPTTASATATATPSSMFAPPTARASRVNNVIRSSIAAAAAQSSSSSGSLSGSSTYQQQQMQPAGGKANKFQFGFASNNKNQQQHQHQNNNHNSNNNAAAAASVKCSDSTLSAKCNEIPSRNHNRNRGGAIYANQDRDVVPTANRGTHPPRTRPTLKPSGTIVSKAQEFVDIYRYPPTRPDPIYPQPTPDKTAAKCRKDVCLLPDCYCGGRDIPAELPAESIPQIVLLTFDDSVNDLNKQLYTDLFEKGRVNPNGCPITATFYVSHEWTDYSQVQNLYADGHEMASHTVSHSFGEQFSQKKWTREIAGQREILAAYGGVKLSDVRGMRAPFLSVGGNKMYKMLYDSNFTYDSSMPVYENRPPSWPYTLDYKIFHDCMIPPCPTRSYPGVWQVPMVMWQDLNGGRCSMGDACSNPSDAEGVTKMIMKNFERHYTTNRAPFGLFYHAAWFTQPHHKEGFIKFLDAINSMSDVWILTNWQALQWVRDPTPISRINSFQPFQCDYSDRPKRCNNPKVCNLWHKSGVRYMKTCQPCPDIYPWTGKSGIRSSRIDNDNVEEPAAA